MIRACLRTRTSTLGDDGKRCNRKMLMHKVVFAVSVIETENLILEEDRQRRF